MEKIIMHNSITAVLPGISERWIVAFNFLKQEVCDTYRVPIEMINCKTKKLEICEARQVCVFIGHEHLDMTLQECAAAVNFKNHSNAWHSVNVVVNLYNTDKKFRKTMQTIMERIGIDSKSIKSLN